MFPLEPRWKHCGVVEASGISGKDQQERPYLSKDADIKKGSLPLLNAGLSGSMSVLHAGNVNYNAGWTSFLWSHPLLCIA